MPDLNYLCVAGAEPPVGLRIYLGDRFRAPAVGGVVVAEVARDGITAWGFDSDGGGLGDAAIGQSLTPPIDIKMYLIYILMHADNGCH